MHFTFIMMLLLLAITAVGVALLDHFVGYTTAIWAVVAVWVFEAVLYGSLVISLWGSKLRGEVDLTRGWMRNVLRWWYQWRYFCSLDIEWDTGRWFYDTNPDPNAWAKELQSKRKYRNICFLCTCLTCCIHWLPFRLVFRLFGWLVLTPLWWVVYGIVWLAVMTAYHILRLVYIYIMTPFGHWCRANFPAVGLWLIQPTFGWNWLPRWCAVFPLGVIGLYISPVTREGSFIAGWTMFWTFVSIFVLVCVVYSMDSLRDNEDWQSFWSNFSATMADPKGNAEPVKFLFWLAVALGLALLLSPLQWWYDPSITVLLYLLAVVAICSMIAIGGYAVVELSMWKSFRKIVWSFLGFLAVSGMTIWWLPALTMPRVHDVLTMGIPSMVTMVLIFYWFMTAFVKSIGYLISALMPKKPARKPESPELTRMKTSLLMAKQAYERERLARERLFAKFERKQRRPLPQGLSLEKLSEEDILREIWIDRWFMGAGIVGVFALFAMLQLIVVVGLAGASWIGTLYGLGVIAMVMIPVMIVITLFPDMEKVCDWFYVKGERIVDGPIGKLFTWFGVLLWRITCFVGRILLTVARWLHGTGRAIAEAAKDHKDQICPLVEVKTGVET